MDIQLLTSADLFVLENVAEGVLDNAVDKALATEFLAALSKPPRHI